MSKNAPYGQMDQNGNVTIHHGNGQAMTPGELSKMLQEAQAEQDAWDNSTEQEKADTLDKLTGGLFSKMF